MLQKVKLAERVIVLSEARRKWARDAAEQGDDSLSSNELACKCPTSSHNNAVSTWSDNKFRALHSNIIYMLINRNIKEAVQPVLTD